MHQTSIQLSDQLITTHTNDKEFTFRPLKPSDIEELRQLQVNHLIIQVD